MSKGLTLLYIYPQNSPSVSLLSHSEQMARSGLLQHNSTGPEKNGTQDTELLTRPNIGMCIILMG